ncbi:MAG: hypothetical protein FGM44_05690 [Limnohabitans sp.]|nr:hypothetical protein [Limnohabitans sp.]
MKYALSCLLAFTGLLASCAGPDAVRIGKQRMAEQDWPGAVQAFEQALKANPQNAEYQYSLRIAREKTIDSLLGEGAVAIRTSPEKAMEAYRKVLLLDPSNLRAIEQLKLIEQILLREKLYQEASQAASVGRTQDAKSKFRRLLAEEPTNERARAALQLLESKQGKVAGIATLDENLLKPVTLSVSNGSIKMLFEALALSHKINFVLDRDLKSDVTTTVSLRDVPFEEALEQILAANGLEMRVANTNTVFIYQATAQKYKEHQELVVRNFFIESADPKEMGNLLKTALKMTDVHVDAKRSVLVVRDSAKNILAAEKLLAAHDQPEPEVMLEVEIIEFNHSLSSAIGIQLPTQVTWGVASPITLDALNSLSRSNINVSGLSTLLQLNMQSQAAITKVLANPKIRIRNREKAKFHVGDKVPVITSTIYPGTVTGVSSSSVSYLDVGIKLEFEPVIQLDGQVVIKTVLEDSSITDKIVNNGTTAYQLGTRNVSTTLTLRDGEMQILAGLIRSDEQSTTNQVPGIAEVPLLGRLFQSPTKSNLKKEILLSITPRVLKNIYRPSDDLLQIQAGTDARSSTSTRGGPTNPSIPVSSPPRPVTPTAAPATPRPLLTPLTPMGQSGGISTFGTPVIPGVVPGVVPAVPATTPGVPVPSNVPNTPVAPQTGNMPVFEMPPGVGTPAPNSSATTSGN